jgi:hypothetical protein
MRERIHEKKVCRAITIVLEEREGIKLSDVHNPDKVEREKKAVDLLFRIGEKQYALEHTQIESFANQIGLKYKVDGFLKPLQDEVSGKLPLPGNYDLCFAHDAPIPKKNSEAIRAVLKRWILSNAGALAIGKPSTAPHHFIRETPLGIPFEVTLYRWPGKEGILIARIIIHENLQDERKSRIRQALNDKCPKLESARVTDDITVLVLELDDIRLGNPFDTITAIMDELKARIDSIPDEVYLIGTDTPPWEVWKVKVGDRWFSEDDEAVYVPPPLIT